jgi:hypothetical protein
MNEFACNPLEAGEGSFDGGGFNAIGDSEIAGLRKAAPGNDKDELFLKRGGKLEVVAAGSFGKEVKSAFRF